MGGQDHRGAAGGLFADQFAQRGDLHRVERVGRFVQHQQGGAMQQRAAQAQSLALALRQHAGQAPGQRLQFQPRDDRGARRAQRGAVQSTQAAVRIEMLLDAELGPHRRAFRQPADLRAGKFRVFQEILAVQLDAAAVGAQRAGDHRQGGRLAGAVHAQQAHHLAALQAQAQVLYCSAAGAAAAEPVQLQDGPG